MLGGVLGLGQGSSSVFMDYQVSTILATTFILFGNASGDTTEHDSGNVPTPALIPRSILLVGKPLLLQKLLNSEVSIGI